MARVLVVGLGVAYSLSTIIPFPERPALLDTWFPAPFVRLDRPYGAPTIDYTVHFRAPLPPPGAVG